jgi:hypothetical protein
VPRERTLTDPRARRPKAERVERKPSSDEASEYPSRLSSDWERDRRVRLPHDHLVKSQAITHAQFEAMA